MSPRRAFAATTGRGAEPAPPPFEGVPVDGLVAIFGHRKYAPTPSRRRTTSDNPQPQREGLVFAGAGLWFGAGGVGAGVDADGTSGRSGDSGTWSVGISLSGISFLAQSAAMAY